MKQVIEFLKANPTYYLATVDGDKPRVRPFGVVAEFEGKLYITTNNQKDVYKQLKKNPYVEISTTSAEGKWIRLEAKATEHDNMEARQKMLDDNPSLKNLYAADDGKMAVFYLTEATATFYSFTQNPSTVTF